MEKSNRGFILKDGLSMILLPEETTSAYSDYLPILLSRKIDIMKNHLHEIDGVLSRWFNSGY